jgi:hypothetical protein
MLAKIYFSSIFDAILTGTRHNYLTVFASHRPDLLDLGFEMNARGIGLSGHQPRGRVVTVNFDGASVHRIGPRTERLSTGRSFVLRYAECLWGAWMWPFHLRTFPFDVGSDLPDDAIEDRPIPTLERKFCDESHDCAYCCAPGSKVVRISHRPRSYRTGVSRFSNSQLVHHGVERTTVVSQNRNEQGRYVRTLTDERVFEVFDAVEGPVITTRDVALDCTPEAVRKRLSELVDRGVLDQRKTGRTVVYWRTESGPDGGKEPGSLADRIGSFGMFADDDAFFEEVERAGEELDEGFEERTCDLLFAGAIRSSNETVAATRRELLDVDVLDFNEHCNGSRRDQGNPLGSRRAYSRLRHSHCWDGTRRWGHVDRNRRSFRVRLRSRRVRSARGAQRLILIFSSAVPLSAHVVFSIEPFDSFIGTQRAVDLNRFHPRIVVRLDDFELSLSRYHQIPPDVRQIRY